MRAAKTHPQTSAQVEASVNTEPIMQRMKCGQAGHANSCLTSGRTGNCACQRRMCNSNVFNSYSAKDVDSAQSCFRIQAPKQHRFAKTRRMTVAEIDKLAMMEIITSALDDPQYCVASRDASTPRMTMAKLDKLIMKDIITGALDDPSYSKRQKQKPHQEKSGKDSGTGQLFVPVVCSQPAQPKVNERKKSQKWFSWKSMRAPWHSVWRSRSSINKNDTIVL